MVDELFFIVLQFTLQTAVLCGVAYLIYFCIKLKRVLNMLLRKITAMDCDEILAALQADDIQIRTEHSTLTDNTTSVYVCYVLF